MASFLGRKVPEGWGMLRFESAILLVQVCGLLSEGRRESASLSGHLSARPQASGAADVISSAGARRRSIRGHRLARADGPACPIVLSYRLLPWSLGVTVTSPGQGLDVHYVHTLLCVRDMAGAELAVAVGAVRVFSS